MNTARRINCAFVAIALALLAACGSDTVDVGDQTGDDTRPTIAGTWVLTALTIDGTEVALPADRSFDLNIDQGQIGGSGGGNTFGGAIDNADDGTMSIVELSWTEMACEPLSILDFEIEYLTALSAVTKWEADPDGITFGSATVSIRYEPGAQPVHLPLVGSTWTFDTILSGDGVSRAASSTDLSLPEVTLVIGADSGTLSSSDCGTLTFPFNYEDGRDGNVSIPDRELADLQSCDGDSNMTAAVSGILAASGFMIDESRLTFVGQAGETVGFRGE